MMRVSSIIIVLLLAGLAGGALFFSVWDIPAPSAPVEKIIPDDTFPN